MLDLTHPSAPMPYIWLQWERTVVMKYDYRYSACLNLQSLPTLHYICDIHKFRSLPLMVTCTYETGRVVSGTCRTIAGTVTVGEWNHQSFSPRQKCPSPQETRYSAPEAIKPLRDPRTINYPTFLKLVTIKETKLWIPWRILSLT
jgi:hypothetical protein